MSNINKLNSLIQICDIHSSRLKLAFDNIKKHLPITAKIIDELNNDDLAYFELLTSRFAKLQDTIGAKLFPLILEILEQNSEQYTLIDRINRLEKLGFINKYAEWLEFRDIRNLITHEYPDDSESIANNLKKIIDETVKLIAYWNFLKGKIIEKTTLLQ